jgi:hypothetical protein
MRAEVAGRGVQLLTTPDFRRQSSGDGRPAQVLLDWLGQRAPEARSLDDVTLSRYVALATDLPAYNLSSLGDRVEMATGLEARLPYLDNAVVDLMWRMPANFHHDHGQSKRVLRAVLARRLPQFNQQPKQAFLTPTAQSCALLNGRLADRWLSRDAAGRSGIFQPMALAAARLALPLAQRNPSLAFYASACLTLALSLHLIDDMFCRRFSETLARRAVLSLDELRHRLRGAPDSQRALSAE